MANVNKSVGQLPLTDRFCGMSDGKPSNTIYDLSGWFILLIT